MSNIYFHRFRFSLQAVVVVVASFSSRLYTFFHFSLPLFEVGNNIDYFAYVKRTFQAFIIHRTTRTECDIDFNVLSALSRLSFLEEFPNICWRLVTQFHPQSFFCWQGTRKTNRTEGETYVHSKRLYQLALVGNVFFVFPHSDKAYHHFSLRTSFSIFQDVGYFFFKFFSSKFLFNRFFTNDINHLNKLFLLTQQRIIDNRKKVTILVAVSVPRFILKEFSSHFASFVLFSSEKQKVVSKCVR